MKRRTLLKAIGIGGLIPFVKTQAAPPPEPQPQQPYNPESRLPPDKYTSYYTRGERVAFPAYSGIIGSASFSTDGVNWHNLGEALGWELTMDGDE